MVLHVATHWLIMKHDNAIIGQIPLDPEYGMIRGHTGSPLMESIRIQHLKLLEEHKDMAHGSAVELSPNLSIKRIHDYP